VTDTPLQPPSEIIVLRDGWEAWEGEVAYPEGTRGKYSVKAPDRSPVFVRSDWRYLFKKSRRRCPWQFWMEIVAYRIGRVTGVPVPPTHAAIGFDGEPGSLCEWMFDSSDIRQGLTLGGEFMLHRDPEYDRVKGKAPGHCHNLQALMPLLRHRVAWREAFARMFVLDTLIANTDRHHDNWGILWSLHREGAGQRLRLSITPAFDNGTSMGYERRDEDLPELLTDEWLVRHATHKQARHHIRLKAEDRNGANMLDLVPEMARRFPDLLPVVQGCATFRDEDIEDAVFPLCDFDMPVRLSEKRARFICRMVCVRRKLLMQRLEGLEGNA